MFYLFGGIFYLILLGIFFVYLIRKNLYDFKHLKSGILLIPFNRLSSD